MKKKVFILLLLFILPLSVVNIVLARQNNTEFLINLSTLEVLSTNEISHCPDHKCNPGGCGTAECTIELLYPTGFGAKQSIVAQPGYFACCYKNMVGDISAHCYPNSCCKGPIYY